MACLDLREKKAREVSTALPAFSLRGRSNPGLIPSAYYLCSILLVIVGGRPDPSSFHYFAVVSEWYLAGRPCSIVWCGRGADIRMRIRVGRTAFGCWLRPHRASGPRPQDAANFSSSFWHNTLLPLAFHAAPGQRHRHEQQDKQVYGAGCTDTNVGW